MEVEACFHARKLRWLRLNATEHVKRKMDKDGIRWIKPWIKYGYGSIPIDTF